MSLVYVDKWNQPGDDKQCDDGKKLRPTRTYSMNFLIEIPFGFTLAFTFFVMFQMLI